MTYIVQQVIFSLIDNNFWVSEVPSNMITLMVSVLCTLPGVSVLDDQCVCLQVRSLTSDAEIPVYVNLQTSSYPLGLLPGAGVEFHRLERKVSRIENVYCQFTTVSTVTLFQVSDSQR